MAVLDPPASAGAPARANRRHGVAASLGPAEPPGRGTVPGLRTAHAIAELLPSMLQEDGFCVRLTQGLDEVVAPLFGTLDCWDAYLDPQLTPEDFVDWLASWAGVDVDERWSLERRRDLIGQAVGLYRMRGTAAGIAAHVALYTGVTPEIVDSGGCEWSQTADSAFPGSAQASLTVRVLADEPDSISLTAVHRIVDASRPAHVLAHVEVVTAAGETLPEADEVAAEVAGASPDGQTGGDGSEPEDGAGSGPAPGAIDLPGSEKVELEAPGPVVEEEWDEGTADGSSDGKEPSE